MRMQIQIYRRVKCPKVFWKKAMILAILCIFSCLLWCSNIIWIIRSHSLRFHFADIFILLCLISGLINISNHFGSCNLDLWIEDSHWSLLFHFPNFPTLSNLRILTNTKTTKWNECIESFRNSILRDVRNVPNSKLIVWWHYQNSRKICIYSSRCYVFNLHFADIGLYQCLQKYIEIDISSKLILLSRFVSHPPWSKKFKLNVSVPQTL